MTLIKNSRREQTQTDEASTSPHQLFNRIFLSSHSCSQSSRVYWIKRQNFETMQRPYYSYSYSYPPKVWIHTQLSSPLIFFLKLAQQYYFIQQQQNFWTVNRFCMIIWTHASRVFFPEQFRDTVSLTILWKKYWDLLSLKNDGKFARVGKIPLVAGKIATQSIETDSAQSDLVQRCHIL